ncbi:MAG: DNA internalization-related competence protein ComEC/Rec2 [Candidatus Omnitrophica bacterium]|nr:DNA internalization-related competence protein ComEC/Rec2 [Candidatus Omnitrophota bacterium]
MQASDFYEPFFIRPIPRPMVKVCLAFLCGVVYARFFPCSLILGTAGILLTPMLWVAVIRRGVMGPKRDFHWRMVLIMAALLGAVRMQICWSQWQNRTAEADSLSRLGKLVVTGVVEETNIYPTGAKAILSGVSLNKRNQLHPFPGRLELLASADQLQNLLPGDRLQAAGEIEPVRGPSVPAGFDSQRYRLSQNILGAMSLDADDEILRLGRTGWSWIRGLAYQAVHAMERRHDLSEDRVGLLASICFGIRSLLPGDLSAALARSGLAHLTSISGLHVTLMLGVIAMVLKRMGCKRRQACWITAATAVFYLFLVGARIPALRAVIMAFVFLGHNLTERRIDSLNSLALAAMILLLIDPAELFLPSFQLSFAAVLILLLASPWGAGFYQWIPWKPLAWILQSIFASAAVVAALAPFTIAYFHVFSWGAIPGNLIAVPLATILLPLTYAWTLSMFFSIPWLTIFLGRAVEVLAGFLLSVIQYFSQACFSFETSPLPAAGGVSLFLIVLLLLRPGALLFEIRFIPVRAYQLAMALAAVILWLPAVFSPWKPLQVDFLALGQGDCIVIRTPDHRTAVIDGGPASRSKNSHRPSRLAQFLQSEGVRNIDFIIVTHPQSDHIGVLGDVVRRFPVSMILEGCRESDIGLYREFEAILDDRSVPRKLVRRGDRIDLGGQCRFWVLNPVREKDSKHIDINEQSVVVICQYYEWDIFLTGDIGQMTERLLCEAFDDWDVDVLKAPHHGSRYSSCDSFLKEIRPEFAVIQVGKNPYGHPSDEARYRLIDAGAHVLRNDLDGTVRLRAWRDQLRLFTTRSNRLYMYQSCIQQ